MINLLVALQAEARPLIKHFGLDGRPAVAGFRRYGNAEINLLVTGTGSVAMAAAVALLGLEALTAPAAWINFGIAGHRDWPVGRALLATKITDHGSGLCWYPPQVITTNLAGVELLTVASPVDNYPDSAAVDMEASGFYPTACRFATAELVQCLKVVSDNRDRPANELNEAGISELISAGLEPLNGLLVALQKLLAALPIKPEAPLSDYLDRWRFTHAQRLQLTRLLQDFRLLAGHWPDIQVYQQQISGEALLAALTTDLNARRLDYSPDA
jgi:hypothetical protein